MKTTTKTSLLDNSTYGGKRRGAPIAGYEQFVLPAIEKILDSSRHLSATSLARFANRVRPGHDHRGCSKVHSAAVIAQAYAPGDRERGFVGSPSEGSIEQFCRELRFSTNGWSRKYNQQSEAAPIEDDREYIVTRLAEIEAELAKPVEPPSSYHGMNRVAKLRSERYTLTHALNSLGEGVGNYTLKLDSKQKFLAVLDALRASANPAAKSLVAELEDVIG